DSIGGTVGAILTCPLEVIKVRLQSSRGATLRSVIPSRLSETKSKTQIARRLWPIAWTDSAVRSSSFSSSLEHVHIDTPTSECKNPFSESAVSLHCHHRSPTYIGPNPSSTNTSTESGIRSHSVRPANFCLRRSVLLRCLVDISRNEGYGALFKGLVPTLIGVLPSRGVYFCAYHKGQLLFENHFQSGSSGVYLCAAGFGSITASSLTNPIWFVKTRLQLDSRPGKPPITAAQIIRTTWTRDGFRGFYRGVSASYVGSLETALNFMVYENIKARLLWRDLQRRQQIALEVSTIDSNLVTGSPTKVSDLRGSRGGSKLNASSDMVLCMIASAFSKAIAITALYPHEVIRTRLREADGQYRGFLHTLRRVASEEGASGLYRGMGTHYIRQVPNSCIMIGTYEVVVFLLQSWGFTKTT
ncbi:Mitochondrial substrate carrier domain-containing protein, partial [Fasciolopsis buskii]